MTYSSIANAKNGILSDQPQPKLRYFLYARKSSEQDDRQVLSIKSQIRELKEHFLHLEIVEVIEESQSAKAPGRPLFDRMLRRIDAGEAQGIISWHPDRLARNSVDGGRIIYDLDRGKLRDLRFAQYTYENTAEGKWMLGIVFGQSKYFVDKLSTDVRRGLRAKLEQGWFPCVAPIGYLNNKHEDKGSRTIRKDPVRFPIVRQLWDMMLTGAHSPHRILEFATHELGFRTPMRKRIGGKPLARSAIYKLFTNPFYYGWFEYREQMYKGKHEPMITEPEFWHVQKLLARRGRPRPKEKKDFAYTGMIRCGECGAMVTAEERWKRNKTNAGTHHYVYYHCTKRKTGVACAQPYIEVADLERQIDAFLGTITIGEEFLQWALKYARKLHETDASDRKARYASIESAYRSAERKNDELLNVRLLGLITDEEFETKRVALVNERERLKEKLGDHEQRGDRWFELVERTLNFVRWARYRFNSGTSEQKRLILETIGSNLTLCDMKLRIEPVTLFIYFHSATEKSKWCRLVDDVRTYWLNSTGEVVLPQWDDPPTEMELAA